VSETKTVLALARHTGGFYHGELLSGLVREVTAQGSRVIVSETAPRSADSGDVTAADVALLVGWDEVDAVVCVSMTPPRVFLERLVSLGKPVILTSQQADGIELPVAVPDNHGGVRAGIEHLLAHGHTRIGFVADLAVLDYRERFHGFLDTMHAHGLPADESLLFAATDWSEHGGGLAAAQILAADMRPTAVMTASGSNAIGLIAALGEAGVRVPHDIAVVSFDNIEQGTFATPSLSSVFQRFDDVGALAGRLVMDAIRGVDVPAGNHVAATTVVIPRGSCGCRSDLFDDSHDPRSPGRGVPVEPGELGRLMHTLLDGRQHGAVDEAATTRLVHEFDRLLAAGDELTGADVRSLVASIRQVARREDTLHEVTSVLTEHVQRLESAGMTTQDDPDGHAVSRIAAVLWQLQNHGSVRQSYDRETHLIEGSEVAAALVGGDASAARDVGWLALTHARAGMLVLWDGPPSNGELRLVGTFDPDGVLDHAVGERFDARLFPPVDLVDAARANDGEVCFVVPVRTETRQWGLLAVLGVINATSSRKSYHQWATLLAAVLEREDLEVTARLTEQRYADVARASNDGLWEVDLTTNALYLSSRCRDVLGVPAGTVVTLADWAAATAADDRDRVRAAFASASASAEVPVEVEYRLTTVAGESRWVLGRGLGIASESGAVARLVGSLSDIHHRKALEEQLRQSALHDALTGLPNRRHFLDRLSLAVERHRLEPRYTFAVLFLDLDGFKLVNDSLGHHRGDDLLTTVAARLRTHVRASDTAARLGGDEFAVLLSGPEPDEVLVVARRIQEHIGTPLVLGEHEVAVTASVGIATSATEYTDAEDVLRDADIAMCHAKAHERGTVSEFEPGMHALASIRLQERSEIRAALIRHEFVVHYQPIVALDGSGLEHFEALVRWQHPDRGLLLPGEFLPAMEDDATIVSLGHWVFDEVCRQIAEWMTTYRGPVAVAVNVAHREFWSATLLETVTSTLERHGVPPRSLVIEVTESVFMSDPATARQIVLELKALGLRLHIDDFGSGQSSLNALRSFPVDTLKIDGAFIRELSTDAQSTALVRAIISMGAALGLDVVAECVETPEQAGQLQDMGCANAQGWLYAKALPGGEAGELLGRSLATRTDSAAPAG
jgi:diguanylate cyclase (GGDEF)-like protein/PAS domain S-box-containing protein